MKGYNAQAIPELEPKIRKAPSASSTTTNGISHHFFSCLRNCRNSLKICHMLAPD
jgi:hypothetical protein